MAAGWDVRTNPAGRGQILAVTAGAYSIRIKLKWFGIKITTGYNSLLNVQHYADTKPYSTSAGGWKGTPAGLVGQQGGTNSSFNLSNNYWLFNLFSYINVNDGQGCVRFKSHLGLNGFASSNFNYALCTDGPYFGFVPTQSALDYGTAGTLDLNILLSEIILKIPKNIAATLDITQKLSCG